MTVTVAMLEKMQSMGLTLEQAIELARMWEEGISLPAPSTNALRQRRYRQRQRETVTEIVTGNATQDATGVAKEIPPEPPKENNPSPPLKGGISPEIPASQPEKPKANGATGWATEIWEQAPLKARQRSSQRQTEDALRAAIRRGAEPGQVRDGLAAYYASADATKDGGEYAKGIHRAIQHDLWQAYAETGPKLAAADEDPWPRRMLGWSQSGYWNSEWGPKPGKDGCLVPSASEIAA